MAKESYQRRSVVLFGFGMHIFESNEEQGSFGHSGMVNGVCISRDGMRVASGSDDETVRLWNAQTGAELGSPLEGHTRRVTGVRLVPTDGRLCPLHMTGL